MTQTSFLLEQGAAAGIKMWSRGVTIEDQAMAQIRNVAKMPFIHKHVAIMPDAHWGMGATVGSVIATKGAVIPAAVGVDIGCGMMAVRTSLTAEDLPDNLHELRTLIEAGVPHGRTDNGGPNDQGAWSERQYMNKAMADELTAIVAKHPKLERASGRAAQHIGTLGTGNHFVEVCLDEEDHVWAMLHSGSRGIGNAIGTYFIEKAKEDMRRWFIQLPDVDLAYIPEGSELFSEYLNAVHWAQDFALANRQRMMAVTLKALGTIRPGLIEEIAVNCHHNYVARENHFNANVLVTRKGAVRARMGDLGIIPGSMGTRSYIVRGKGNPESFCSCSHGAGRAMSRGEAKRRFTLEDHAKATQGIECRKDIDVIDETPGAYKPIDAVMAAQEDLVEVAYVLRQVLCVKG